MKQKLLAMMFALFAVQATVWAEIVSGYCGNKKVNEGKDVTWTLVDTILTISGTGDMANYTQRGNMPWSDYKNSIVEVVIEQGVTSIGNNAFASCSALTTVTIPNSVTSIGTRAFRGCNIVNATIDMTYIGDRYDGNGEQLDRNFSNSDLAANLTNLTIGSSVTGFDGSIIRKCTSIVVDANNPIYDSRDNCNAIIRTADNELIIGIENTVIPNTVTSIGRYAFEDCTGLTNITIPNSVTRIGGSAFEGCTGLTNITIPNSVTHIGGSAFEGCTGLTSIVIPNSVTSIESLTFRDCTNLTEVTIGSSVDAIYSGAFDECSSITTVTSLNSVPPTLYAQSFPHYYSSITLKVPDVWAYQNSDWAQYFNTIEEIEGLEQANSGYIGDPEVNGGKDVTWSLVDSTLTISGKGAMADGRRPWGDRVKKVIIEEGVTNVGSRAFSECTKLTDIVIPNTVTSIGAQAFERCFSLTDITLPNSVTSIGMGAFHTCQALTSFTIPDAVTRIEDFVFGYCRSLEEVIIPNSVTSIGYNAFYLCFALSKITIPNSVETIGNEAFNGCSSLKSITIPASVTRIGDWAFFGYDVSSIVVEEGNTFYDSRDNCNAIIETATNTLVTGCKRTVIPNTVTAIKEYAFSSCYELHSITIPASVTSIGENAFNNCSILSGIEVEVGNPVYDSRENSNGLIETATNTLIAGGYSTLIPNGVTCIENNAFWGRNYLTEIVIPNTVTSIGKSAFEDCKDLTDVTIGSSVTSIGAQAFANCSSLSSVTCLSSIPPTLESLSIPPYYGVFDGILGTAVLRVPDVEAYKASDWAQYFKTIMIVDGVGASGYCGDLAVNDGKDVTWHCADGKLTISGTGAIADYYAWDSSLKFKEVVINEGITKIGTYLFSYCDSLVSIIIPASVTYIDYTALLGCPALVSIVVDENNTVYDSRENCNAVIRTEWNTLIVGCRNTVIPNSVTKIGENAFSDCNTLMDIVIPNTVNDIGSKAFGFCSGLTNIAIPNLVTTIYNQTFQGCDNLKEVTIGSSVTRIGDWAFWACNSLSVVTCLNSVPPTLGSDVFSVDSETAILRVPDVEAYRNSEWAQYFSEIVDLSYDDIDDVEIETNRNDAPAIIHDLSGRRVTNPVKGQIYIVNGKAVVM